MWIASFVLSARIVSAQPVAVADESSEDSAASAVVAPEAKALARKKFLEARAAHEAGRFEEAAELFEAADRISPHASTKFNAAIAWDRAGARARAADAYEAALNVGGLTPEQAEQATERLSALKKTLGYLRIDEPIAASVSVAHLQNATIPVRVHVQPGPQLVAVEEPGGARQTRTVRVGAGRVETVTLQSQRPSTRQADTVRRAQEVTSGASATRRARPPRDESKTSSRRKRRAWGWAVLGTGVALSGAAIALGISALSARDEFEASGRTAEGARDRAATLRLWTNASWGGAAAFGGTGLGLLLSTPKIEF